MCRPTLGALLTRLTGSAGEEGALLLRSHPLTSERRAMLEAENLPPSGPALLDDSDDFDVETVPSSVPNRRPDPRLQRVARLAALDPNDGIPL